MHFKQELRVHWLVVIFCAVKMTGIYSPPFPVPAHSSTIPPQVHSKHVVYLALAAVSYATSYTAYVHSGSDVDIWTFLLMKLMTLQVTGVVGRAETLASVFFLGAFIFYTRATKHKKATGNIT